MAPPGPKRRSRSSRRSHVVNHPEVEGVDPHVLEGDLQMFQGAIGGSLVGFARQEDLLSSFSQGQAIVGFTPGIGSCRFKIGDAQVDGLLNQRNGISFPFKCSENTLASKTEDGKFHSGFSKRPFRHKSSIVHPWSLSARRRVVSVTMHQTISRGRWSWTVESNRTFTRGENSSSPFHNT